MRRSLAMLVLLAVGATACDGDGRGRKMHEPAPRLFLAGDGEMWIVDTATERLRRLVRHQLVPGDPVRRIVRRGRRLVLWGYTTYASDPGFRRPFRVLAERSWFFLPSAHPHRVWVTFLDPRTPATVNALRAVSEMTVDGSVTVPEIRPPRGAWPHVALRSGLILGNHVADTYELWDPVRRKVVRSFRRSTLGQLGPAHGDLLASCRSSCASLRLTHGPTGRHRGVAAPAGYLYEVWNAAFAPDGRRLGIPIRRRGTDDRARALALVDVERRTAIVVPGSRVPAAYSYTYVAWSANGRHVFFTGGERLRKRTIVAFRLGDSRGRVLRVRVGDFYDMAAL